MEFFKFDSTSDVDEIIKANFSSSCTKITGEAHNLSISNNSYLVCIY